LLGWKRTERRRQSAGVRLYQPREEWPRRREDIKDEKDSGDDAKTDNCKSEPRHIILRNETSGLGAVIRMPEEKRGQYSERRPAGKVGGATLEKLVERITPVALRWALGLTILSAVADRIGLGGAGHRQRELGRLVPLRRLHSQGQ